MKWLILLALLVVVTTMIVVRYRRQIKMAIYVWRMFRKMKQVDQTGEKRIEKQADARDIALVRCAKCGTWIPQNTALNLRSANSYCSTICLETAAKVS